MDNPYLPPSVGTSRQSPCWQFQWVRARGYFIDVLVATAGTMTLMGILAFFLNGLSIANTIDFFHVNPAFGWQIPSVGSLVACGRRFLLTPHFGDSRLRLYLATIATIPFLSVIEFLLDNLLHIRILAKPPGPFETLRMLLLIATAVLMIEWALIQLTAGRRRF